MRRWIRWIGTQTLTVATIIGTLTFAGLVIWEASRWRKEQTAISEIRELKGSVTTQWGRARSLTWNEASVKDVDLRHVRSLTRLRELSLGNGKVTDAGLEHLEGLTRLKKLNLGGTLVTDAGLKHLKGLTNLQLLWLHNTKTTNVGIADLERVLPKCRIQH